MSHQVIVSGLKSLWPNLPFQSEETNVPDMKEQPLVSKINGEVMRVAKRDEEVPMGKLSVYFTKQKNDTHM